MGKAYVLHRLKWRLYCSVRTRDVSKKVLEVNYVTVETQLMMCAVAGASAVVDVDADAKDSQSVAAAAPAGLQWSSCRSVEQAMYCHET